MAKRDIHVIPKKGGWAVQKEGADRAGSVSDTQREAIERAREQAKRERVEVVIHKKDGSIWGHESYGFQRTVTLPPVKPRHLTMSQIKSALKKRGT